MFTGIIESMGIISDIANQNSNITFTVESPISAELKIDQSVAHNGVCLTVVASSATTHQVTAIAETLSKTNLSSWQVGHHVNLERAMILGARLDGHMVQGHVDTIGTVKKIDIMDGSWVFTISYPKAFAHLVIEKGSICLNGTSLTCFNIMEDSLQVAIIPYTYNFTTMQYLQTNDAINIEFDIIGKYLERRMRTQSIAQ